MKKLTALLLSTLILAGPAFADSTINALGAGAAVSGTDILPAYQGANPATGVTADQIKTFANTSAVDARTTTSEAIATSDQNKLVTFTNASAVAATIGQATSGTFFSGWATSLKNLGAGTVTLTPTTSTIDGNATLTLTTGQGVDLYSDGTNYFTQPGKGGSSTGANPTATAGPTAVNGSATTFMRSDAAPAIQLGSASQAGLIQCGTGTSCSGGVLNASGGSPGGTSGQIQTNNGSGGFGALATTTALGHPSYATGAFYATWPGSVIPGQASLNNRAYFYPFFVSAPITITSLNLYVTTVGSGDAVMVGIYNDVAGAPSGAAMCVPAASQTIVGTGNLAFTVSCTIGPGWYWMGTNMSFVTTAAVFMSVYDTATSASNFLAAYLVPSTTAAIANGSGTPTGITTGYTMANTVVSGSMPTPSGLSQVVNSGSIPHVVIGD